MARQIAEYHRSGFTVVGIIGVGASPSCGVRTTLDIRRSFEAMAGTPSGALDRRTVNRRVLMASRTAGTGIRALDRELGRRGLALPLLEHDLIAELHGTQQHVLAAPVRTTAR